MTTAPLLSSSWYRVAALRPRLLARVRLHRQRHRGELAYLLQDPASGKVHQFSPAARLVIAAMDGRRTVQQLWELANHRLGDDAPTQDELIRLLGQLHAADLLHADVTPDVAEVLRRGQRERRSRRWRSVANPMAIRMPLWDPDAWLRRMQPLSRVLWSRGGAVLWLAVVLPALLLLPAHWAELTHNLSDRVLQPANLLALALVFAVVKLCHELGHASATKAGGGEVHDLGVMLLVLMPVPYVDASAASVFESKWHRALVGAAGMLAELFIAALAFYAWLALEPGWVRALAFNVMVVAGVSTVVFNANPLLRYDGYFILADLVEIPNLGQRAAQHWMQLLQQRLLGLPQVERPTLTRGQRAWFLFYGPASALYRVAVTVAIALFIAGQYFFIGVVLALWAVAALIGMPLFKALRFLITSPQVRLRPGRSGLGLAASLALLAGLALVPLPWRTQAQGVLWMPEQAAVRAGADAFVAEVLVPDGSAVRAGTPLVRSVQPLLDAQIRVAAAEVAELQAQYANEFVVNRANADLVDQRLQAARAALQRACERADGLLLRAGTDGVFRLPQPADRIGRFHRKGELLGYVLDAARPVARVVLAQADAAEVPLASDRVQMRLAGQLQQAVAGRVLRQVPAGDDHLPSRVLALDGGGPFAVDPSDAGGTRTLERTFQLDIEVQQDLPRRHFGERVYVRFEHEPSSLATQAYRELRRLFLRQFHV